MDIITWISKHIEFFIAVGSAILVFGKLMERISTLQRAVDDMEACSSQSVSMTTCERCRDDCDRRNASQFAEIKEFMRDMNILLNEICTRIGRLEGIQK